MLALLLKDLGRQKYLSVAFAVVIVILSVFSGSGREWIYLLGSAVFLMILVVSSTLTSEGIEERFAGYLLLKTLPVGVSKIVGTKFILQFAIAIVGSSAASGVMYMLFGDPAMIRFGIVLMAWALAVALVFAALSFIGIYALGIERFTTVAKVTVITLILIPQLLLFYFTKTKAMPDFRSVRELIAASSLYIPLLISISLYGIGFFVAVRIKKRG